jgi:hypothetical protein
VLWVVIGIAIIFAGFLGSEKSEQFHELKKKGVKAAGTLIDVKKTVRKGRPTFRFVVQFTDAPSIAPKTIPVSEAVASLYIKGNTFTQRPITLVHDPTNLDTCRMWEDVEILQGSPSTPIIPCVIGSAVILAALWYQFRPQRPRGQPTPEAKPPAPVGVSLHSVPVNLQLKEMFEKPQFIADPVFPKDNYLQTFGTSCFRQILAQSGKRELVEQVRVAKVNQQMAMLVAGSLGFWAIDIDIRSQLGVSGKDEFLSRANESIRRPPPEMAAFTAEQHILARGVVKIQIEDEPRVAEQYQICKLKIIGWYVAALVSPRS